MRDRELALCLDLVLEGGSSAQCADPMSSTKFDSVAQCTGENECKIQMNNKEAKWLVDVAHIGMNHVYLMSLVFFVLCYLCYECAQCFDQYA